MRDRTRELHQDCGHSSGEEEEEEEEPDRVALMGLRPPAPPGADTLLQAQGVRAALRVLEQKLEALEQQQEAVLGTPLPPEGLKRDLQVLRDEIQELTREIRARLQALEPGKEEEEDENRNTIRARVKRTQHGVLLQQFLGLTERCHAAQARYRQRSLERIRRQLHIAGNTSVTDEELEQMLETGHSEVFISNVLGATRVTRAALEEVGVRHQELQRLEKSLRDLGEIFSLLGTTIEAQGEVIDRIEKNIAESGTSLRKGQQHLGAAQRSQRGGAAGRPRPGPAPGKKLLLGACVIVTVVIIVAIIAVTVATG
ncbi:syntaxin-4 [Phalacrocorax carbo]|uniref:syntaxin-4 n=1 Tax=Phalacrocorax carbo TaxID=9209 RepID=UPI0031192FC1